MWTHSSIFVQVNSCAEHPRTYKYICMYIWLVCVHSFNCEHRHLRKCYKMLSHLYTIYFIFPFSQPLHYTRICSLVRWFGGSSVSGRLTCHANLMHSCYTFGMKMCKNQCFITFHMVMHALRYINVYQYKYKLYIQY